MARPKVLFTEEDSEANAREAALTDWIESIAAGVTQRAAAIPIEKRTGYTYKQMLGWCERDPEGWGRLMDAAIAAKVERMESVLRRIATAGPDDITEDPGSAKVRASTAQWLLSKWDRKTYGDARTVDQQVTLKAPSDDTPERIAEDALALLTDEQRAELIRKIGGGQ